MNYISLHNHTTFSILDSLIRPKQLFERTKELGMEAVGVTDHGTLAGAYDCLKESKKSDVKLIIGIEGYFVDDIAQTNARLRHIILLAKNAKGYRNLLTINKLSYDNGLIAFKKAIPRMDWTLLEKYSEGLICTTACGNGIISQLLNLRQFEEANQQARRLKDIFGDSLAVEIQAHALQRNANLYSEKVEQTYTNRKLIELARELDIKVVVTTDAHYTYPTQHASHDATLALNSGQPVSSNARLRYNVNDFYIKSPQEIFDKVARNLGEDFAREVMENTLYFADKCEDPEWIDPKYSNPSGKELPQFPVADQSDLPQFEKWLSKQDTETQSLTHDVSYMRYKCLMALDDKIPSEKQSEYLNQLDEELDVLEFHGFSSYMLIVADILEWARKNGIRVGFGRGSVGGSLVAYLLNIHATDPIKYHLIFARFHNKEKTSYPDIDLDISKKDREKVLHYVMNKYGEDHFAHVCNFNNMTPKPYAKAVSRIFEYGGGRKEAVQVGNMLAGTISAEVKSVDDAFEQAPLFVEFTKRYPELKNLAKDIGGIPVALSTHAAGVIVSARPLVGLVPLRRTKENEVTVEYNKETCEENGLIKIDLLGLETLDIITLTLDLIKKNGKTPPPEPFDVEQYDEKTYEMIGKGETLCVFQLGESPGTISLCQKVKPQNLEDLATINALARPSAKTIRQAYINARDGASTVELLHPSLERAFKDTLGFSLYEECLLHLAQDSAKWDQFKADNLRKLTKDKGKHPKLVAQWRKDFINDAMIKGHITERIATKIWDDIVANFGGYGFNHSHAIFYSMLGFYTAYLKAHFPIEFLTANLMSKVNSNAQSAQEKVAKIKEEIRKYNIKIIPPDINKSDMSFTIIDDQTLMCGLDSLKYVKNKEAINEILSKRPFQSFEDFLRRVDSKKVRAPVIQALASAGCLDSISQGISRRQMFLYAKDYKQKLKLHLKKSNTEEFKYPWPEDTEQWSIREINALERMYIGEGLSGRKDEIYPGYFKYNAIPYSELPKLYPPPDPTSKIKERHTVYDLDGEIKGIFVFIVKKEDSKLRGKEMARITLEDARGNQMTVVCFPSSSPTKQDHWQYFKERYKQLSGGKLALEPGNVIRLIGQVSWYEDELSIIFEELTGVCGAPTLPSDLESKQVSMKTPRAKKNNIKEETSDNILDDIESELIEEGKGELENDD